MSLAQWQWKRCWRIAAACWLVPWCTYANACADDAHPAFAPTGGGARVLVRVREGIAPSGNTVGAAGSSGAAGSTASAGVGATGMGAAGSGGVSGFGASGTGSGTSGTSGGNVDAGVGTECSAILPCRQVDCPCFDLDMDGVCDDPCTTRTCVNGRCVSRVSQPSL